MTVATYPLGRPRAAAQRGGDCRARDLNQARNVSGPHRFAAATHCQINNGLLRVSVFGATPSLTIEGRRGAVTVSDTYVDLYSDLYGGSISTPEWLPMGYLSIAMASVTALLTGVRIVRISPEAVTIRLVAPLMADAFVTLRRGERMVRIQHGSTRAPLVTGVRTLRWEDTIAPAGTANTGRIEEVRPANHGFMRWIAALDTVTANAGVFTLSSGSVTTARFGAGVGTYDVGDRPIEMHSQLGDASRPRMVVT